MLSMSECNYYFPAGVAFNLVSLHQILGCELKKMGDLSP